MAVTRSTRSDIRFQDVRHLDRLEQAQAIVMLACFAGTGIAIAAIQTAPLILGVLGMFDFVVGVLLARSVDDALQEVRS